jgi:hypothetical protein
MGKNDKSAAKGKRTAAKAKAKTSKTAKVRPNMEIPNLACN